MGEAVRTDPAAADQLPLNPSLPQLPPSVRRESSSSTIGRQTAGYGLCGRSPRFWREVERRVLLQGRPLVGGDGRDSACEIVHRERYRRPSLNTAWQLLAAVSTSLNAVCLRRSFSRGSSSRAE